MYVIDSIIVSISQQHSQCFVFSWLENFSTNLITEACWGLDVEAASPVWVATAPMPNERLSLGMSAYRLLKGCFGKIYFIHTHCKFHKTLTWKKIISEHQVARFHIISLFGLIQPILQCIDIFLTNIKLFILRAQFQLVSHKESVYAFNGFWVTWDGKGSHGGK